ncbi:MAG: hypothetical protein KBD15_03855 [Candidatus Magasanikbacteria bacterium]|jgi:hypothetical protein|nr:hypothetical protein [Candidatus Magasanikbacteria bacterium]
MQKSYIFIPLLCIFLGFGCQQITQSPSVNDFADQRVIVNPERKLVEPLPQNQNKIMNDPNPNVLPHTSDLPQGVKEYHGWYFLVEYPANFSATPTEYVVYNKRQYYQTDEAYFLSPDKKVEFFVYSPLWGGDPKNYLTTAPNEEVVSTKTETKEVGSGKYEQTITWTTLRDKNNTYYRSFVSIQRTEGQFHHVFGIKYTDETAYETYRDAYVAFKESLQQFSD